MKPREYQTAADEAVWDYLRTSSDGHPLIVLPTGAGKSLVIAMLIQQAIEYGGRVIVLAHRKELLEQNLEKIKLLCPGISSGIYSAGLRRYDTESDVICAGIQSVHRKALLFGRRELIIVDEAHLISDNEDSMFSRFIGDLVKVNPRARLVGLTATPYRTGEGLLSGPDRLFSKIVYEAFTGDLIGQGFLCPLTNQPTDKPVDVSGVAVRGGEFVARQMEAAFDQASIVDAACQEIAASCHDRRSVIVFCSGVDHAEHVAETLRGIVTDRVRGAEAAFRRLPGWVTAVVGQRGRPDNGL
jgi:DNA repair protein RadD